MGGGLGLAEFGMTLSFLVTIPGEHDPYLSSPRSAQARVSADDEAVHPRTVLASRGT